MTIFKADLFVLLILLHQLLILLSQFLQLVLLKDKTHTQNNAAASHVEKKLSSRV